MADILYVTTDNIRSALGMTSKDVSDAQIVNAMVEAELKVELLGVYPDYVALDAAQSPSPTPEQEHLYSVLQLYMKWQGAVCMLPAVQFLIEQKISDTSFEKQRFMKDDLQETIDRIMGQRDKFAAILQTAAGIESASASPLAHMGVAAPAYDPVTNGA